MTQAALPADPTVSARQRKTVSVPPEVLRQVKLIELRTRRLVNSVFSGEYRSIFKGHGMEFAEVREYQPGARVVIDGTVYFGSDLAIRGRPPG